MVIKVSHDDVFTTVVEKKVKSGHQIGRTGGVRGDVGVEVDGNLVYDGSYEEELGGCSRRRSRSLRRVE